MTLSIARYRTLTATADDTDYIVQGLKGGLTFVTAQDWEKNNSEQQPARWKKVKQDFLDCLEREWGAGV